eukprot:jgi/Phyca11/98124/e_gw1.2.410.1
MIQPFYSDNSSVDKARTFWSAFERATEGLDDSIRLGAFRECLKGKTGEEWWTYSQINDFATLKTRFHNQFICQTPLQMIERLKTAKRSRGMSAEVWADLISSLCDEAQYFDPEMRYQYFLSGLRNRKWRSILDTSLVNSIPEAVTVLLYKNQHLPQAAAPPPATPTRGIRQGPDMYTQDGHIVCGRCHMLGCNRLNCRRNQMTCTNCQAVGHISPECEQPQMYQRQQPNSQPPPQNTNSRSNGQYYRGQRSCFLCGGSDHVVANCPSREVLSQLVKKANSGASGGQSSNRN